MAERTYKIRSSTAGPNARAVYRLTVPAEIAEVVPEGKEFTVELNDLGILYKPVEPKPEPELPRWARPKK
jgi:hypothetical protein